MPKLPAFKQISNDSDYQAALDAIQHFHANGQTADAVEQHQFELLVLLTKAYELRHRIMLSPVEAAGFYQALHNGGI